MAVTGDASAYLALQPASGPNGVYASYDNGQLQVVLGKAGTGRGATGSGVNLDAVTTVKNVFTITNQGSQTVGLWLTDNGDVVTFKIDGRSIEGKKNAIIIEPGTTKPVSLVVDTRQAEAGDDLLDSVTFHSDTAISGIPAQSGSRTDSKPPELVTDSPPTDTNQPPHSSTPHPTPTPPSQQLSHPKRSTEVSDNVVGFLKDHPALVETFTSVLPFGGFIEWAHKNPMQAMKLSKGAVFGETGMPDGWYFDPDCKLTDFTCVSCDTASSPWYLVGWLTLSTVPGVDIATDFRDALQNLDSGDTAEFLLDAVAIVPVLGKFGDAGQIVHYTSKWTKMTSATDEAASLVSKYILPHVPDSIALKLLDILTDGKASKLHDKGVPVDQIVRAARNGNLDDLRRSDSGKRLVTDGGRSPAAMKKALGNGKFIDDDLTKQNYRHIAKHGEADETLLAVKPKDPRAGNGKVVWLQKGDRETGCKHIKGRHIKGTNNIDGRDATSFFPVGQTVKGTKLPDTMSKADVKRMIYDAIKKGDATARGDETKYYFKPTENGYPNSGVNEMRVIVTSNGEIKTAFPLSGPAVKRWISQLNGGQGGFVDTA